MVMMMMLTMMMVIMMVAHGRCDRSGTPQLGGRLRSSAQAARSGPPRVLGRSSAASATFNAARPPSLRRKYLTSGGITCLRGKFVPIPISTSKTLQSRGRRSGWATAVPAAVFMHRILSTCQPRAWLLATVASSDGLGATGLQAICSSAAGAIGNVPAFRSSWRYAAMHRLFPAQPPPLGRCGSM